MLMSKRSHMKSVNMLSGPILPELIKFSLPIIFTGVLQQLYTTADNIVVGQFGGDDALAAVGATSAIINILVAVFINIFVGTNILVARSKGAGDDAMLKKIVSTTYIVALAMGLIITLVGELLARPMLLLTACPEEILPGAMKYLRIYFIGIPASMFMNFAASVIRTAGDSRTPFLVFSLSGIVNVIFNVIFTLLFRDPVASVAIATIVSMYLSAVLFFIYMCRMNDACRLHPLKFSFNLSVFLKTIKYGIPSVISSVSFSLTTLIITPAINAFGKEGMAGSAASASVEAYLYAINNSFMAAVVAFVGQNIGAGNRERVGKVLKTAYLSVTALMSVYTVAIIALGRELLWLFIPGATEAIEFAQLRLTVIMSVAVINGIMNVNAGALQAYGYTIVQMISNLVGVCAFRIVWMTAVYPFNQTPLMLWICYPISWVVTCVAIFIVVMIMTYKYTHNKGLRSLGKSI